MREHSLSVSQKELWTELLAWPDSIHLNIGGFTEIEGPMNMALAKQALDTMVAAHDTLRLVPNGKGVQVELESYDFPLITKSFSDASDPRKALRDWQQEWMKEPFLDKSAPPVRFALLSASETCHFVVIQCLHTLMDGWSLSNTVRKWGAYYTWLENGQEGQVEAERPYAEFIEDSLKYMTSKSFAKDQNFWQDFLPALSDPLFEARYRPTRHKGVNQANIQYCDVSRALLNDIEALTAQQSFTPFHVFMAALAIYICRSQNKNEFVIGVPTLNRGGNKFKNTLGMFVSVLPIKINIGDTDTAMDVIQAIAKSLKQCYRYAKYPMSEQFKRLNAIQHGRERLFDVIFSYEKFEFFAKYGEAQVLRTKQTFPGTSRYPLAISLTEFNDFEDAEMVLEGNQEYFSSVETQLVGKRILDVARQIVASTEANAAEFNICPQAERETIIHALSSSGVSEEVNLPFHTYVQERATLDGNALALISEKHEITYQQMMTLVQKQAHLMKSQGVKSGDVVCLALQRGPEVVISMLATSKLGASFLVVDVEVPTERLRFILSKSETVLVLTNDSLTQLRNVDIASLSVTVEEIEGHTELLKLGPTDEFELESTAYILFTSGSTGAPKGVKISHKALIKRLAWIAEQWEIDHNDCALQATQVNFDPALVELVLPLIKGGRVAFAPKGRLLPESLPSLINQYDATLTAFVPSTLTRFMDGIEEEQTLSLRVCCCGGEVLSPEVAQRFVEKTGADLYNVYGPTEATIFASAWHVRPNRETTTKQLPIGTALSDTSIFVLDDKYQVQPYGVPGELFIGGDTVSSGYIAEPEKNASSFITADVVKEQRFYRTGDVGWLDTEGRIHFIGRKDRQIKLRGYRIELGEIEQVLQNLPEVLQAAADVVGEGVKRNIQVWITTSTNVSDAVIRKQLAANLPDYMLPAKINILSQMPFTANGKIDYKKLPVGQIESVKSHSRDAVGRLEKSILAIWKKALKRDDIGVNDNFFEYGGDSLSAVVSLTEIEEAIGKRLSLHQLVENPTVATLADCIETELELPKLLVSLGDTTRNVSLYIAASGNGDLLRFEALAKAMHGVCDLHMLQPPGNETGLTIEELASLYTEKIAEREKGAVYIAGFSVGGLAALETARLLKKKGIVVQELFIVDTILMKMPQWVMVAWRKFAKMVNRSGIIGRKLLTKKFHSVLQDRGLFMQVNAMHNYQPSQYRGQSILIKSSRFRMIQNYLVRGWQSVIGNELAEFTIKTSHSGFFEPGRVDKLAKLLRTRIKQSDS